jgi:serine/threonine-protein kinase RsbT
VEAADVGAEQRIEIRADRDIVSARSLGRALAEQIGFEGADLAAITTAISEVARNIVQYAETGEIALSVASRHGAAPGIEIVARDRGPGIDDVDLAMQDGYSTHDGLGLGLPGTRRMMDEFELRSERGEGTTVVMRKWRSRPT